MTLETQTPSIPVLFDQLGLPSSDDDIEVFISLHRPLPANVRIFEAAFWTEAQAKFLREQIACDADWAVVVDKLDTELRK